MAKIRNTVAAISRIVPRLMTLASKAPMIMKTSMKAAAIRPIVSGVEPVKPTAFI